MPQPELVRDDYTDEEMTERKGEMLGYKAKEIVEAGTAPLGVYVATRSELPWWARAAGGAVALVNLPKFTRWGKRLIGRGEG